MYEQLLASPGLKEYRSVARVRTKDYWQDAPERQSLRANYDAVVHRVRSERVVIQKDEFWPVETHLPVAEILPWLEEQHNHGV